MLLLPGLAHAAEPGDISDKIGQGKKGTVAVRDSEEELYGYPLVGSDHTALYYLDTESCGYGIDGGRATLECIVYGVGRGKESAYMLTYIFETYKKDGKRKIFLRKVVAETGHDLTQNRLKWDNGFARHLFWQAAEACGLQEDLD